LAPAEQGAALRERFGALAATQAVTMTAPQLVRAGGERLTRRSTRAAFGITALIAVATAFTVLTSQGPAPSRPKQVQPAASVPATSKPSPSRAKAEKAATRQTTPDQPGLPPTGRLAPDSH
ncbi:hypothetical protein ADK38_47095, partial [Streptomyces varsoviensis]